ncbi:MAG: L-histidine N(alpha)-methyltransferase, partial [Candidatus Methylomirabilales bacterium]
MRPSKRKPKIHIGHQGTLGDPFANLAEDVRQGLTKTPKELSPKYFYDARGAALFDQISEL